MISLKDFFTFERNRSFWIQIIAMVATLIIVPILVLCWLNFYTLHGETVVVPSVKGSPWNTAIRQIESQSLHALVVDSSYVKGAPAGSVLEQNPAGGAKVKEGRTIYLTINAKSAPTLAMPDIMDNSSLRQAEAKLRAMGFRLTEPQYVSGERDWVYSVRYNGREVRAGEKIPHEALLTLCVGNGGMAIATDSLEVSGEDIPARSSASTPSSSSTGPRSEKAEVDDSWF